MIGQDLIATGIYLISAFILFWLGKLIKDLTTTSYSVREELVEKDNAALGVAMAGYYFGLILAIGGTLSGPSQGLENDLIDIGTLISFTTGGNEIHFGKVNIGGCDGCSAKLRMCLQCSVPALTHRVCDSDCISFYNNVDIETRSFK